MTGFKSGAALSRLVLRESLRSFTANRSLQTAATLAYFGFLSLMPLLLLTAIILGLLASSSERALTALAGAVESVFPAFDPSRLQDISLLTKQKAWGVVSLVLLVWSMTPFAEAMREALLGIFKTEVKFHFARAKLRDISAVFWLMLFFIFLAGSRLLLGALQPIPGWMHLLEWIASPAATALALTALYRVFTPLRLPWWELLCGGVAAALLLAFMRPLFGLVLRYNPGYGEEFGSLKAIFLVLVWVYYLFAVILLGAEIIANVHRRESLLLRKLFVRNAAAANDPLLRPFILVLADGAQLFREGEPGEAMYYVLCGEIELRKGDHVVKAVQPSDYFGEMSLLLAAPRSATAHARGETHLIAIDRSNFDRILRESPAILMSLLQEMSRRLQNTTEALAQGRSPGA